MQTVLRVEGMTCSHCESAVKNAVSAIDGVSNVTVDLAGKTAIVTHDESVSVNTIRNEIEEQGFEAVQS